MVEQGSKVIAEAQVRIHLLKLQQYAQKVSGSSTPNLIGNPCNPLSFKSATSLLLLLLPRLFSFLSYFRNKLTPVTLMVNPQANKTTDNHHFFPKLITNYPRMNTSYNKVLVVEGNISCDATASGLSIDSFFLRLFME